MKMRAQWTAAVLLACCSCARAAVRDPFVDFVEDWGGLRIFLRDSGIDVRINYVSETASNIRGGTRELWRYADQWAFATAFNLEKIVGLERAQFKIAVTDRNGHNLSKDAHLGSLQEVQEIWGRGQTWHWTQFSYDQTYLGGGLDWKVGRLTGGEDFADFSCEFTNLALCGNAPGNIAVNYWYNWPVSQWATRLKASIRGLGYLQLGVYEFNPDYLQTKNGLNLGEPGGATGVLVPVEIGWQPQFAAALIGSYKFGGWYNSSKAPDAVSSIKPQIGALDGAQPHEHNGEYGVYVNFLQQLTTTSTDGSNSGLSAFFNATFADKRTSTLDSQIALGLLYAGAFATRPADGIGVAAARTRVNSRIAAAERFFNATAPVPVAIQGSEYAAEIFYSAQVTTWLQLRPDVQYIYHPGGVAGVTDDVIAALRISVSL